MCGGISPGWLMLSVKKSLVILNLTPGEEELVISAFICGSTYLTFNLQLKIR